MRHFLTGVLVFFCLSTGAQAETLFESQRITKKHLFTKGIEGPAVDREGNLYVVNFAKEGTIGRLVPGSEPQLFLQLPSGSVSNSLRFNAQGELIVADRKKHRLLKLDLKTKALSTLAESSQLNQPNDFTIARDGRIFLSDPTWSSKKMGAIWIATGSDLLPAFVEMKAVNGIDLSPDETKLFATESIGGGLWVFDVKDKKLSGKRLLVKFKADTVDGLRVDRAGNIYVARITEGKIDRISPEGQILNSISTEGKDPTNLAFGGPDGKTVYLTIRDTGAIESFRAPEPGREWDLQR